MVELKQGVNEYAQILQREQIVELLRSNGAIVKNTNVIGKNVSQKNQAVAVAAELAPEKVDMIYESSDSDSEHGVLEKMMFCLSGGIGFDLLMQLLPTRWNK